MAWRALTDSQWQQIATHLSRHAPSPRGGRPQTDDRKCFEEIVDPLDRRTLEQAAPPVRKPGDLLAKAQGLGGRLNAPGVVAGFSGRVKGSGQAALG